MSYLTDRLRAEAARLRGEEEVTHVPGQMLEDVLRDAKIQRRSLLKGSFGATIAAAFGTLPLVGCGGSDDEAAAPDYGVKFKQAAESVTDDIVIPEGYKYDVLFAAGDAVTVGAVAFNGTTFQDSTGTEKFAGGQHDGMHFFAIPGVDPQRGGLLAINHENLDAKILFSGSAPSNWSTATAEQRKIALSAVGVTVIEIELVNGNWRVKAGSTYNKRYTGNTTYAVSGPAASVVGATVVGTLNNCSSGETPWGTYLTCEETTSNYFDPSLPANGYGWVVEIDPRGELAGLPVKRTALGRFDHENTAYMVDADNNIAFYMGDDGTPGCIYKFVPTAKYNPTNRAANINLLDDGILYAAKFKEDGEGEWVALVHGQNGLTVGAVDPGNTTRDPVTGAGTLNFTSQADVLIDTKGAARVAGATLMDRPEWVTVGPDKKIYVTLTKNSSRQVADDANPRTNNLHGHIIKWTEAGNSPKATTFEWDIFLLGGALAGDGISAPNEAGTMVGDSFSSPDGLRIDPKGRLWVQTDADTGPSITDYFGNNSMYYVDQVTKKSTRFLVGPNGCEITGIAYTPDLTTFFINIQHPTGTWPSNKQGNTLPARSATVVVRRIDGQPVGA